jgi:hypothetical protein
VKNLAVDTAGIDTTWANSALQAKTAVESLGKGVKLSPAADSSLTRIMFFGKVMDPQVPKDFKPAAADPKLKPEEAILAAEQALHAKVGDVAKASMDVFAKVPENAPQEVTQLLDAIKEHVTDSLEAIKFSGRFAPPPAPPASDGKGGAAPAGNAPAAPAADGKAASPSTPAASAPAADKSAPAKAAPAAAPAPKSAPASAKGK